MSADRVAYWLALIEPVTEPGDWTSEEHRVCGLNADRLYGGRDLTHPERAKLRPLVDGPLWAAYLYARSEAYKAANPLAQYLEDSRWTGGRGLLGGAGLAWTPGSGVDEGADLRWRAWMRGPWQLDLWAGDSPSVPQPARKRADDFSCEDA